jgi:hypothetical protein
MMRTLALLVRRPDLTRYAFRNHYEDTHVRLAEPLLDEAIHYVRNHVQAVTSGAAGDFDVLSEFGYPSVRELDRLTSRLAMEAGRAIAEDERRFMDKPRNRFFELTPRAAGRSGRMPDEVRAKFAVLARRQPDVGREDFLARFDATFARLASEGTAILTFETAPLGAPVPCDAVAFVWPGARASGFAKLVVAGGDVTVVRVDERVSRRAREWGEA